MNTRGTIVALGAVALLSTNMTTWWSLRRERERVRAARDDRDDLSAQLARANAEKEDAETLLRRARRANDRDGHALSGESEAQPGAGEAAQATARPPLRNPYHRLTRAQRKLMARQGRGELFVEAGLSESQIDALLDLEIERENAAFSVQADRDESDEPLAPAELSAQLGAVNSKHQSAVVGLLGARKAALLQQLEGTLPVRGEVRMVRDHLEGMGLALDDAQRAKLTQLVMAQPLAAPVIDPAMTPDEARAQMLAITEGRQHRLRDAAKSLFTPDQLAALDAYHDLRRAMLESAPSSVTTMRIAGTGGLRP